MKIWKLLLIVLLAMALLVGCGSTAAEPTPVVEQPAAAEPTVEQPAAEPVVEEPTAEPTAINSDDLILATTTSTQDSGLLDYLLPMFAEESGINVAVIAAGTGQALKLGEDGNADVLLVHARAKEDEFMEAGHGTRREDVMYNDFIIVGPAADPAGIKGMDSATEAFEKIASAATLLLFHAVTIPVPTPKNLASGKKPVSNQRAIGMSPPGKVWARC